MLERKAFSICRACLRPTYKDQILYENMHFICLQEEQYRINHGLCIFCKEPAPPRPLRFEGPDGDITPNQASTCGRCDVRNPSRYPILA